MGNMNIVFSINNNYVPYCLTTICSICENNKSEQISFYILNTDISEQNKSIINTFLSNYSNCSISYILLTNTIYTTFPINQKNQTNKYISIETYFRLFLTEILPTNINKVLYLDSDLIIRGSLHDLYDTDLSSVAIAAVRDNEYFNIQEYNRLRYEPKFGYFNAGVLLINLDYWRKNDCYKTFTSFISSYPERLKKHDQDVLNSIFYNCKKFSDYDLKLEIYPKDDGTTIFFKIQKEIEDKDFIKRILEKMNILNDFNKKEDCWNFYFRNLDITKNFEIKEYILNFLQKFDDFVSKI